MIHEKSKFYHIHTIDDMKFKNLSCWYLDLKRNNCPVFQLAASYGWLPLVIISTYFQKLLEHVMLLEKYMHVFFACPVRSNPALCVEYASNRLYYLCTHDPPPFPAAAFSRDVRSRLPLMVLSRSLFRSTLLHPYRFWHSTTKHLLLENRTRSMINPILFHQSDSFMHICC